MLKTSAERNETMLLLDDKVSVGLIEGPACERGVRREPFMEDELVLVTPRISSLIV
jgi:hypothetical protein